MPKNSLDPIDKHVGSRVRMRRMMLGMSQTELGDALDLTFQQIQKYEKGTNRIGAGKLQQSAHFLQVPVTFFFEGAPSVPGASRSKGAMPSPAYVTDFLATREGLALMKAFMQIKNKKLRGRIATSWKVSLINSDPPASLAGFRYACLVRAPVKLPAWLLPRQ